jgi:DNA mismatch endonuclease, patch repair protein
VDPLSPAERSERMGRVRAKDTKPEMVVRRLVHGMGYRYRLHSRSLPGKPDLVFPGRHKVILVHGCFWHLHKNCRQYRFPRSRLDFWGPKLAANQERDARVRRELEAAGWEVLVVWECEIRDRERLARSMRDFLGERNGIH